MQKTYLVFLDIDICITCARQQRREISAHKEHVFASPSATPA